ncbi:MAG TPA: NrfD/PsrC family molybdoenzyme membrane anchor subunit [Solirubrobacteraceae bacterium]|nr:NrfD/PsrC family molybdoenzyme membrane anchor subunit [Solirubrobacteraceae bacterium]
MSHAGGPPPEEVIRRRDGGRAQAPGDGRDTTPAVGRRGEPGGWRRAVEDAGVALLRPRFEDGSWSFLFRRDTAYAAHGDGAARDERVAAAARRARGGDEVPVEVQAPVINAPVWTWEVPLYFWFGGIATGAAFAAAAADVAGDHRTARIARLVSIGAIGPGTPLLILDLGRPARFLHMLRIFKLRSPMSTGAWCLVAFSNAMGAAVAADLLGRPRAARALGGVGAGLATYLGSYTGVLLASTAVPVWARSRAYLPPMFMCTAAATGAAATRLALAASGTPPGHPSRVALGTVETAAMAAELALSEINERRLGPLGETLGRGRPGRLFAGARAAVLAGLALRAARGRGGPWTHHVASVLYLAAGLAFRFAWVGAGRASAADHEAVARNARRGYAAPGA